MKISNFLKIVCTLTAIGISPYNYMENNNYKENNYKHPFMIKTEKEFQRKRLVKEVIEIKENINIEYHKIRFLEQRIDSDNYPKEKYIPILNESYIEYKNLIQKRDSIYRLINKI